MNIAKLIGFLAGVGLALLLCTVAIRRRGITDGSKKTEYDERQKIARGEGYKYGYYTLVIYLCLILMIDMAELKLPCSMTVVAFTGFCISGLVLSGYAIMHDAYWGVNNNAAFIIRVLIALGAINLIYGIVEICKGNMVVNGILQDNVINLEAGILILGIGIMLLIAKNREAHEESES